MNLNEYEQLCSDIEQWQKDHPVDITEVRKALAFEYKIMKLYGVIIKPRWWYKFTTKLFRTKWILKNINKEK